MNTVSKISRFSHVSYLNKRSNEEVQAQDRPNGGHPALCSPDRVRPGRRGNIWQGFWDPPQRLIQSGRVRNSGEVRLVLVRVLVLACIFRASRSVLLFCSLCVSNAAAGGWLSAADLPPCVRWRFCGPDRAAAWASAPPREGGGATGSRRTEENHATLAHTTVSPSCPRSISRKLSSP